MHRILTSLCTSFLESNPSFCSTKLQDTFHLQHFFNNEQLNFEPPLHCIALLYSFAPAQKPVQTHTYTHQKKLQIVFLSLFLCYVMDFGHALLKRKSQLSQIAIKNISMI